MKSNPIYFSAAVNQKKKCFDWNKDINLIAYAARNRIVLYNPQICKVIGVSEDQHGNKKQITCVKWVDGESKKKYLLSTDGDDDDGSTIIWEYNNGNITDNSSCEEIVHGTLKHLTTLPGPNKGIFCGHGLLLSSSSKTLEDEMFVVTTGFDHCIRGFRVNIETGEFEETFSHYLPESALAQDLIIIPSTESKKGKHWPLVLYGGDDGKIHILTSEDGREYKKMLKLSGHLDWVMSLSYVIEGGDILVSSGSKDGLIRLWRISHCLNEDDSSDNILRIKPMEIKVWQVSHTFEGSDKAFSLSCSLESVMQGHEGLVPDLDWHLVNGESMSLLSCSETVDRSIIVWEPQTDISTDGETIWVENTRLGEVGGNREGYLSAKFGPCGDQIAAVSFNGGLHLWHYKKGSWVSQSVTTGHFKEVVDLDWEKEGRYLLTVSKDQTTRLHAELRNEDPDKVKWQEIGRPQVHGYDMACVASLGSLRFASGAEELIARGFMATKGFVRTLHALGEDIDSDDLNLPEKAEVPSLGLSNKGEDEALPSESKGDIPNGHITTMKQNPPTEDELILGTLWPEISKLYSHGHTLVALASSHDSSLLASSCIANVDLDAKVVIWDTKQWKEIFSIICHRLTVIQMEFSSCDKYLLTVSKDRTWAVCQRDSENVFTLKFHSGKLEKKFNHTRIIWSCAWVPNSLKFVTGSRDKNVFIWHPKYDEENQLIGWERAFVIKEEKEVTAVAVDRLPQQENILIIAIGCVDGSLLIKLFDESQNEIVKSIEVEISHFKSIRRLKFRPRNSLILASCSDDHSVILHKITL